MSQRPLFADLPAEEAEAGWLVEHPPMKAEQVLDAIARRHDEGGWGGRPGRWVFLREVPAITGRWGEQQRFDALAVGLVPSVSYARVVYEVKVSRTDWLRELRPRYDTHWEWSGELDESGYPKSAKVRLERPGNKWDAAFALSTEFWYAAPPKTIAPNEVPDGCGLIEVRPWGKDGALRPRVVVQAPVRESPIPGPEFWSSVLRHLAGRRAP